jgi:hypothetical protein
MITSDTGEQLIGYFYLPGRKRGDSDVTAGAQGTSEWFFRTKLNGDVGSAPILIDRLQGVGSKTTNIYDPKLSWTTTSTYSGKSVPTSVHRGPKGAPEGGNFTYEDGHVEWFTGRRVSLGSDYSGWQIFFKVPTADLP